MLTLLSAATLTVSSVMALTLYYPIAAVERVAPSEIEFKSENTAQFQDVKQIFEQYYPNADDIVFTKTDIYKVTSSSNNLPMEYSLGASQNGANNEDILREAGFECISYSQYITLLKAQGKEDLLEKLTSLTDNEVSLVKYQPDDTTTSEQGNRYVLNINGTENTVVVKKCHWTM